MAIPGDKKLIGNHKPFDIIHEIIQNDGIKYSNNGKFEPVRCIFKQSEHDHTGKQTC